MQHLQKKIRIQDRDLLDSVSKQPCLIGYGCMGDVVAHHVTTVGAGGDDVPKNLAPLCVTHHVEWHWSVGKLMEKYPLVRKWLKQNDHYDILDRVDNLQLPFSKRA